VRFKKLAAPPAASTGPDPVRELGRSTAAVLGLTLGSGIMETASSRLARSIGTGGAVFIGFILFWFLRVYFKKRRGADHATAPLLQRTPWEEKRKTLSGAVAAVVRSSADA